VNFIKSKIRAVDTVYRLHGDEFIILFESNYRDKILLKINQMRKEFFEKYSVGTSWGMMQIDPI
jgi:GGDEF domain-containing protein